MDGILKFLEKLDEMVYVSEMDTFQIVYMNGYMRDCLGGLTEEQYQGKKCYELLQGNDTPCYFCKNDEIKPNEIISWVQKNPILKKRFLNKACIIERDGKRYRLDIAVDMDSDVSNRESYYYARSETVLNECLQRLFVTSDPEESLKMMLEYLGGIFLCSQIFVSEIDRASGKAHASYEWCKDGDCGNKKAITDVPLDRMDYGVSSIKKGREVVVLDVEKLRESSPYTYQLLKESGVHSIASAAVQADGELRGVILVCDPDPEMLSMITSVLNILGYFVAAQLKRRDILRHLKKLSYLDALTGAYNRNALMEHMAANKTAHQMGVIYCDITGLKKVNDTIGHAAGDQMICDCFRLIQTTLDTKWIYRTGGDEFVAVYWEEPQKKVHNGLSKLRAATKEFKCHIASGSAWSDQKPINLETLISQADLQMYQDKQYYYRATVENAASMSQNSLAAYRGVEDLFEHFLAMTYHDAKSFFESITQENSAAYFYFGDMQKNLYYISDNMRDEFGFESNVVPNLLNEWAERFHSQKTSQMFWEEIHNLMEQKRGVLDLRFQMRNIEARNIWVHCYGIIQWDYNQGQPLFFSGRMTHQDDDFVVDPVTNFPKESVMLHHLDEQERQGRKVKAIAFGLNGLSSVNNTQGRHGGDRLIRSIADALNEQLGSQMRFYRLDGMRCAAVVEPECPQTIDELTQKLRKIVQHEYDAMGISMHQPCSMAVMEFPKPRLTSTDFLNCIIALLRVARNDPSQPYVDDSDNNLQRISEISNMALRLSRDVLYGMENFRIVVQPLVSSKNGQIIGGEVLLRWRYQGKDIPPDVFIPMLEAENMIHIAGRWVLEEAACACAKAVHNVRDLYFTVNVSRQQLFDPTFADFVEMVLEKYQLDGHQLVMEMTESCMDEDPEKLMHFVKTCEKCGIRIALDDFGTGYSSLRVLLRYPTDIIKLDRSLLNEMMESSEKMNFVSSIVYACHRFGKKVCMEGVENPTQNEMVRESNCDLIQGFYYYRPMELDALYDLMKNPRVFHDSLNTKE